MKVTQLHEFYRGLFRVDGTMTIKEVKDGAKIKLEQDVNNKAQWGAGMSMRKVGSINV